MRLSHRHIDGQMKGIDEPYSNGLMFPATQRDHRKRLLNADVRKVTM